MLVLPSGAKEKKISPPDFTSKKWNLVQLDKPECKSLKELKDFAWSREIGDFPLQIYG